MVFSLFVVVRPAASADILPDFNFITNGDFETGDFTGWTITTSSSNGNWLIDTPGTTTPLSGNPTSGAGGQPNGNWYAVADQNGPGVQVLAQTFTLPAQNIEGILLSYDLFTNNWSNTFGPGGCCLPSLLNYVQITFAYISTATAGPFDFGTNIVSPGVPAYRLPVRVELVPSCNKGFQTSTRSTVSLNFQMH